MTVQSEDDSWHLHPGPAIRCLVVGGVLGGLVVACATTMGPTPTSLTGNWTLMSTNLLAAISLRDTILSIASEGDTAIRWATFGNRIELRGVAVGQATIAVGGQQVVFHCGAMHYRQWSLPAYHLIDTTNALRIRCGDSTGGFDAQAVQVDPFPVPITGATMQFSGFNVHGLSRPASAILARQ